MKSKNIFLFIGCVFINLLIGNVILFMLFDLRAIYLILISIYVLLAYGIAFHRLSQIDKKHTKWRLAGISFLMSLFGMLISCIMLSIGIRLPMDNIIIAGIKGIIPLFVFAVVLASPFWIPLAVINFTFLNFIETAEK